MKADLLERVFRAIATDDEAAVDKLLDTIVREERKKGHVVLADRLESITKSKAKNPTQQPDRCPTLTVIPREQLRYHTIFPAAVEQRFQRIEREYAARDRLAHYGFNYKQKILLYGLSVCGKTMGAERLAWNTGLPLLKAHFDTMVSSYLSETATNFRETATNFREIFEVASKKPCLLFIDECDSLTKSREDNNEVGEMKRVVNIFLQVLDEYHPTSGLLVVATKLNKSLRDVGIFDEVIKVPHIDNFRSFLS